MGSTSTCCSNQLTTLNLSFHSFRHFRARLSTDYFHVFITVEMNWGDNQTTIDLHWKQDRICIHLTGKNWKIRYSRTSLTPLTEKIQQNGFNVIVVYITHYMKSETSSCVQYSIIFFSWRENFFVFDFSRGFELRTTVPLQDKIRQLSIPLGVL